MPTRIVFVGVFLLVASTGSSKHLVTSTASSSPLDNPSLEPTTSTTIIKSSIISSTSKSTKIPNDLQDASSTTVLTKSQINRSTETATAPTDDSTRMQANVQASTQTPPPATSAATITPTLPSRSRSLIARTKLVRELLEPWNTWGNIVAPIQEGPVQVDRPNSLV